MTKRNPYILAALGAAIAPQLNIVAIHDTADMRESGVRKNIETAVILDARGNEYDIAVGSSPSARRLLRNRALAAKLLMRSSQVQGLSPTVEKSLATGEVEGSAVIITSHLEGQPIECSNLTLDQCAAVGTAIATIHLLEPRFLIDAAYPRFSAEQIHTDLSAWITRLKDSPEVPNAIVERWKQLVSVEALWDFNSCVIHGGFLPNDFLFRDDAVSSIRNWENIQVSDPARDFSWVYEEWMSDQQRDAVLSAYGRMMGSQMDARVVPRARLWRQMDIVRDLLRALEASDRAWIRSAHERMDRLASLLGPVAPTASQRSQPVAPKAASSTITVGTLLSDADTSVEEERKAATPTDESTSSSESSNTLILNGAQETIANADEADDKTTVTPVASSTPAAHNIPTPPARRTKKSTEEALEASRAAETEVFSNAKSAELNLPNSSETGDTSGSDNNDHVSLRSKAGYVSLDESHNSEDNPNNDGDSHSDDGAHKEADSDSAPASSETGHDPSTSAITITLDKTSQNDEATE